ITQFAFNKAQQALPVFSMALILCLEPLVSALYLLITQKSLPRFCIPAALLLLLAFMLAKPWRDYFDQEIVSLSERKF
ncbi:MAG: hypothetical protein ABF416_06435, partial [Zymomonas mobilis subsp. pomaceae]